MGSLIFDAFAYKEAMALEFLFDALGNRSNNAARSTFNIRGVTTTKRIRFQRRNRMHRIDIFYKLLVFLNLFAD